MFIIHGAPEGRGPFVRRRSHTILTSVRVSSMSLFIMLVTEDVATPLDPRLPSIDAVVVAAGGRRTQQKAVYEIEADDLDAGSAFADDILFEAKRATGVASLGYTISLKQSGETRTFG